MKLHHVSFIAFKKPEKFCDFLLLSFILFSFLFTVFFSLKISGEQVNETYKKFKGTFIQIFLIAGAKLSFHLYTLYTFTH